MARQLSGYTFKGLAVPSAYLNISSVDCNFAGSSAQVVTQIYADKASRDAGENSLATIPFNFDPSNFEQAFGGAPGLGLDGSVPAIESDAIRSTAYHALLAVHPDSMQLLANSTVV